MRYAGRLKAATPGLTTRNHTVDNSIANRLIEQMRPRFDEHVAMAKALRSPNSEDTDEIKCAVVGFSTYSATANWERDHYDYVSSQLEKVPRLYNRQVRLLQAMCLGCLCGMAFERKLTDKEFQLAHIQLPGYLLALGGKVTCEPVAGPDNAPETRPAPRKPSRVRHR